MNEWRIVCIRSACAPHNKSRPETNNFRQFALERSFDGHWRAYKSSTSQYTPGIHCLCIGTHTSVITTGYFHVCNFPGVLISLPPYMLPANPRIWIPRPYCREIHRGVCVIIIILYCMLYACVIYDATCTNTNSNTKSIAFALLLLLYYYTICTHTPLG